MKNLSLVFLGIFLLLNSGFAQTTLDASFDASQISAPPDFMTVRKILVQPDGKILFGGTSDYDNAPANAGPSFGRLNTDGSWDAAFQNNVGYTAGTGFYGGSKIQERSMALDGGVSVRDLLLLPDGKIIVVGDFSLFNNSEVISIARLNADGTLDTFGDRSGFTDPDRMRVPGYGINAIARQANGQLIIGGDFSSTGDISIYFGYIARIDANGFIDPLFSGNGNPNDIGFNAGVNDLEIQPDGDVLVAGRFSTFKNVACGPLARLNSDYTLDAGFFAAQGTGFNGGQVTKIVLQPDGKIIAAGTFTSFNGVQAPGILRLNSDGSLDPGFSSGTGSDGIIYSLAVQSDGRVLVGGQFSNFNGLSRSGLTRLNPDGSVDTSFDPGSGIGGRPVDGILGVYALSIQPDKKILAGGDIGSYNGTSRYSMVRLTDAALPVKLVAFEVKSKEDQAVLNWSTSFETNSESFGIERSTDGKTWQNIGEVIAGGESTIVKQYSFTDSSPINGHNFYRLKMTDTDKTFAYSRIKSATFSRPSALVVYPNPAKDMLYVKNTGTRDLKKVTLYNEAGDEIKVLASVSSGIDLRKLLAGKYILKIEFKNQTTETKTFLVQH